MSKTTSRKNKPTFASVVTLKKMGIGFSAGYLAQSRIKGVLKKRRRKTRGSDGCWYEYNVNQVSRLWSERIQSSKRKVGYTYYENNSDLPSQK